VNCGEIAAVGEYLSARIALKRCCFQESGIGKPVPVQALSVRVKMVNPILAM
jgi:hypothetical protein